MKEIKDYLHLYPGCEVQYEHKFTSKEGSEFRLAKLNYVGTNGITFFVDLTPIDKYGKLYSTGTLRKNIKDITPILRPLSDITEEECIKANSLSGDGAFNEDEDLKLYYTRKAVFFEPEEFRYLLSIGIDLFGLISAGLAVDKTT